MAYVKRKYCEFRQFKTGTLKTGRLITVELYERDYVGSATKMVLGATPITVRQGDEQGKVDTFIMGWEAYLSIVAQFGDDYTWLVTSDDLKFKLLIKVDLELWWSGFVLANQYQEDYLPVRTIKLTASDRLGLLKDFEYKVGSPLAAPTGWNSALNVIQRCLEKTGLYLHICCMDNLFEVNMLHTSTDDPYKQSYIDQELWVKDDLTVDNCKTVLEDILKSKIACIKQSEGKWWIQRIAELADDDIAYREFSESQSLVDWDTLNPQVSIDKDFLPITAGGIEYESGWQKRDIEIDYVLRNSLIPSFLLTDEAFVYDENTNTYSKTEIIGWDNVGAVWERVFRVDYYDPSVGRYNNNRLATGTNAMQADTGGRQTIDVTKYITPTPDGIEITEIQQFTFSIKTGRLQMAVFNWSPQCAIEIRLVGDNATTYYYDDKNEEWSTSVHILRNIPFNKTGVGALEDHSITIKPAPYSGLLYIFIYAPNVTNPQQTTDDIFFFSDIRLEGSFEEDEDRLAGVTYTNEFTDQSNYVPSAGTLRLSDSTVAGYPYTYQNKWYKGFIRLLDQSYTKLWNTVKNWDDGYEMPLISSPKDAIVNGWISDVWYQQYATANKIYRGSFKGTFQFHNTINFTALGVVMMPLGIEIDLKANQVDGTFVEVKPPIAPGSTPLHVRIKFRHRRSMGDTGAGSRTNNGVTVSPGGDTGNVQFNNAQEFDGAPKVNWDGAKLKVGEIDVNVTPTSNPDATSTLDIIGSSGHAIIKVKRL